MILPSLVCVSHFDGLLVCVVEKLLGTLNASILKIPERHPTEVILLQPKQNESPLLPCVTVIHGGPHASTTTSFAPTSVALALQGCMRLINAFPIYTKTLLIKSLMFQIPYAG